MVNHHCCVPGCSSDSRKAKKLYRYPDQKGVKFFAFPAASKNLRVRLEWVVAVGRAEEGDSFVSRYTRVCSKHFVDGEPTDSNPNPTVFDCKVVSYKKNGEIDKRSQKVCRKKGGRVKKIKNQPNQSRFVGYHEATVGVKLPGSNKNVSLLCPLYSEDKDKGVASGKAQQKRGSGRKRTAKGSSPVAAHLESPDILEIPHPTGIKESDFSACQICIKGFTETYMLEDHLTNSLIHQTLKSASRNQKLILSRSKLTTPCRSKSRGAKTPVQKLVYCNACGLSFFDEDSFAVHLQSHILEAEASETVVDEIWTSPKETGPPSVVEVVKASSTPGSQILHYVNCPGDTNIEETLPSSRTRKKIRLTRAQQNSPRKISPVKTKTSPDTDGVAKVPASHGSGVNNVDDNKGESQIQQKLAASESLKNVRLTNIQQSRPKKAEGKTLSEGTEDAVKGDTKTISSKVSSISDSTKTDISTVKTTGIKTTTAAVIKQGNKTLIIKTNITGKDENAKLLQFLKKNIPGNFAGPAGSVVKSLQGIDIGKKPVNTEGSRKYQHDGTKTSLNQPDVKATISSTMNPPAVASTSTKGGTFTNLSTQVKRVHSDSEEHEESEGDALIKTGKRATAKSVKVDIDIKDLKPEGKHRILYKGSEGLEFNLDMVKLESEKDEALDKSKNPVKVCLETEMSPDILKSWIKFTLDENACKKADMSVCPELYICPQCREEFTSVQELRFHIRSHGFTLCIKCGKTCDSIMQLVVHNNSDSHEDLHACHQCGLGLPSKDDLKQHLVLHHLTFSITTDLLTFEIYEYFSFLKTLASENLDTLNLTAVEDENDATDDNEAEEHKYSNADEIIKQTSSAAGSETEATKSPQTPKKIWVCLVCRVVCIGTEAFKNHISKRHSTGNSNIPGEVTSERGKIPTQIIERVAEVFVCGMCRAPFRTLDERAKHIEEAHGLDRNTQFVDFTPYACKKCDMHFENSIKLRAHLQSHGFGYFPCKFCREAFSSQSELDTHILKKHMEQQGKPKKKRVYKNHILCAECGYKARSQSHLAKHMTQHIEERNVACSMCDKKFKSIFHCKDHIKKTHSPRDFHCDQCPKAFKDKPGLLMHLRFHNDIRPYPCTTCNKSFHTGQNMRVHQQKYCKGYEQFRV